MCTSFGVIRTMGPGDIKKQLRGLAITWMVAFLTVLLMQSYDLPWKSGRLDQVVVGFIPEGESRKFGTWD